MNSLIISNYPDIKSMMVKLSPRQQEKILQFLEDENWRTTRTLAMLQELAQFIGIIQLAVKFYLWAIAQL